MRWPVLVLVACATPQSKSPHAPPTRDVSAQQRAVEAFFGAPMPHPYDLRVEPTRRALAATAATRWKLPELPCFAVAMGTGSMLLLLDPAVWKIESCDHADDGPAEIDRVIAHELVHVFHGQHRPSDPELERAEDAGWFVEGLATYASGQLDARRLAQVRELVARGGGPSRLADAWTGPARYGVAGTLVRWIDQRVGRARLVELLSLSTTAELLAAIPMTEPELLAAWRGSLNDSAH